MTDHTRILPHELISRILHYNMEDVHDHNHQFRGTELKSHLDPETGPWSYAHVCRRWRSIVLADIRCWSDVALHLDRTVDRARPGRVALLKLAISHYLSLHRQGGRLLRIHLLGDRPSKQEHHPYLDELVRVSAYWRTAALALPHSFFPSLEPIHGNIPHLKTLDIKSSDDQPLKGRLEAFDDAPQLTNIEVFGFPHFSSSVLGPWSRLQRITFMFSELVDSLEIVFAARKSVRFLFLEQPSDTFNPLDLSFPKPVDLECLEVVLITLAVPFLVQCFTDTFRLPALKHIYVQTPPGNREALTTPDMMASWCRMLNRSNLAHSLHTLDFTNVATDDQVAEMLGLVPGVKWLGLMNCSIPTSQRLTYIPFAERPCLCRELTKFRNVLNQPATSPMVAAYMDLIHSRTNPTTVGNGDPYRPVHLPWCQIAPLVDMRDLKPSDRRKLRKVTPPNFELILEENGKETPWLYEYVP